MLGLFRCCPDAPFGCLPWWRTSAPPVAIVALAEGPEGPSVWLLGAVVVPVPRSVFGGEVCQALAAPGLLVALIGGEVVALSRGRRRVELPRRLPGDAVAELQLGASHVLARTAGGRVFAWGGNARGELGLGDTRPRPAPEALAVEGAAQVLAEGARSYAVDRHGAAFAWGAAGAVCQAPGDLLLPGRIARVSAVCRLEVQPGAVVAYGISGFWFWGPSGTPVRPWASELPAGRVLRAIVRQGFFAVLWETGVVASWGSSREGCLGVGRCASSSARALRLPPVVELEGGSEHLLARSEGGVFAWGRNGSGQLGLGDFRGRSQPAPVRLPHVLQVLALGDASYALTGDGVVYAWGAGPCVGLGAHGMDGVASPEPLGLTGAVKRLEAMPPTP